MHQDNSQTNQMSTDTLPAQGTNNLQQQIDSTANVAMSGDDKRDDGFVDPTNSPKSGEPLTAADLKVNMWKKMIIQGKQCLSLQLCLNEIYLCKGVCMTEILAELRDQRPDLNSNQLKLIFTLLLDRVYNQKEAQVQD